ncbi:MAG: ATP-binding protein [Thermodesulfobacteriota bacterium]
MGRIQERCSALFRSLGFRIGLTVGLILLVSYVVFIFLVLNLQQEFYLRHMIEESDKFSAAIVNAAKHSMLRDDAEATASIIRNIGQQAEIMSIRICNHEGVTKFSNQPVEVGTKVDKHAEACFACHSKDKPFSHVLTHERFRIHEHAGERVLGMITPIYNEKSCSAAPCHVHPETRKVLGVLDVGISLRGLDELARSLLLKTVLFGLGTCVTVLVALSLYMAFRVHRPVRQLRNAAWGIALGDYSQRVPMDHDDQLGECAQGFNIMRDQIRRRTQELTRSRWEYKTLFEQVPCLICVIDKNYEIVRQNSYMREFFKGTIGAPCFQAFKKRAEKCEDCHADKAFSEGKSVAKQHCGITGGGDEADYISYVTPITDEKGEILYVMIMAVDIRDRVKLERDLERSLEFQTNLIQNSIHGIIATDQSGHVAIFNSAAEHLLGYSAAEAIGDDSLEKYFPHKFVELIVAASLGRAPTENRLVAQETVVTSSEGEIVPVRFTGFLMDEKGKPSGAVGFYQDLRTFKQLEREKQASDRLAVVGQTVAGLAHGIKNILTGLEGGVYVVQTAIEDGDTPLLDRGWKMVENNISRISGLVKDLLSYARERTPQFEETDPNLLAEEVCALFDMRAQERSIIIERRFDPSLGRAFKIFLDQRGIHTCLSNLIANAIDACEADETKAADRIVVTTRTDQDLNVVFEVSDNGVGMSPETKAKIFSSFFSTKGSRGTGLGLLVTSKIVMEHGGEISFTSELGKGSTFVIRLPPARQKRIGRITPGNGGNP